MACLAEPGPGRPVGWACLPMTISSVRMDRPSSTPISRTILKPDSAPARRPGLWSSDRSPARPVAGPSRRCRACPLGSHRQAAGPPLAGRLATLPGGRGVLGLLAWILHLRLARFRSSVMSILQVRIALSVTRSSLHRQSPPALEPACPATAQISVFGGASHIRWLAASRDHHV